VTVLPSALTEYTTVDGDPWALLLRGHVDPGAIVAAVAAHDEYGAAYPDIEPGDVEHRYMRWVPDAKGADEGFGWTFCGADDPGAQPVTCVRER